MDKYARDSQSGMVGASEDVDLKSSKPFIELATKIFNDRGQKTLAAGMNPVVRPYIVKAQRGYYRSPEEIEEDLAYMESELLYEFFPEEFDKREAARIAEGSRQAAVARQKAMTKNPEEYDAEGNMLEDIVAARLKREKNTTEMPEDYRLGGRVKLI